MNDLLGNTNNDDDDDDMSPPLDSSKSKTIRSSSYSNSFKNNINNNINNNNAWRCVCAEAGGGSFLPPGLLQTTFGGAVAALRMSTGECYHKQQQV